MRNCSEAHVKILLQNFSDVGAANLDSVLFSYNFNDLGCGPDAGLLLLSDGVNCKLELALFVALFDSKLADVVWLFFNPAD